MARKASLSMIVAVGLLFTACGDDSRPKISEWQAQWDATRELVPDAAAIEKGGAEVCGTLLGEVQEQRDELTPAPTKTAEDAFIAWAEAAETLGLDCESGAIDLDEHLARIHRLADRVDDAIGGR